MSDKYKTLRIIWGVLLSSAGLGMFLTIPAKVHEFQEKGRYFFGLKFMFYLISVLLVMGGVKKIVENLKTGSISQGNNEE